jgi:hypothetical protein
VVWWHRASAAALRALPPALRARRALPVTIGGLAAYRESPVGPYRELVGAPVLLGGALPPVTHVAFMPVESEGSVQAGRANWALPKALARFDGEPGGPGLVEVQGDGFHVLVDIRVLGPRVPAAGVVACDQVWPDGAVRRFRARLTGRARLARVTVGHREASPLEAWLRPGTHLGLAITGRYRVSSPEAT